MSVGPVPNDADLDTPPWNDGGIAGEHFVNYIPANWVKDTRVMRRFTTQGPRHRKAVE